MQNTLQNNNTLLVPVPGEHVYVERMTDSYVVDPDGHPDDHGVFGTESGFCYGTWTVKEHAEEFAATMNMTPHTAP